jgi:hypothetical protein
VLSVILITTLYALSSVGQIMQQDLMGFIYRFATLFAFSSLTGALLGYLSGKTLGSFIPGLTQAANIWFVLTYFLPVYAPLTTVLTMVLGMLPLPAPVIAGLTSVTHTFIAFTIIYYLAAKIGAVPV